MTETIDWGDPAARLGLIERVAGRWGMMHQVGDTGAAYPKLEDAVRHAATSPAAGYVAPTDSPAEGGQ